MVEHPVRTLQSHQSADTLNIAFEKFADVKVLLTSIHQASSSVGQTFLVLANVEVAALEMATLTVLLVFQELAHVPVAALTVPFLAVAGALVVLPPAFVNDRVQCYQILIFVPAVAVPVPIFYPTDVPFFCIGASVNIHCDAD